MRRVTVSMALMVVSAGTVLAAAGQSQTAPSSQSAYKIEEQPMWRVNNVVGAPLARLGKDGWHVVYVTSLSGSPVMVMVDVDGKLSPKYNAIGQGSPILSPDGKRVAYMAKNNPMWLVVVDGKGGPEYGQIRSLRFSPDGKRVAYVAVKGWARISSRPTSMTATGAPWKCVVIVDGKPGPDYDQIGKGSPIFSPDGKRVAYVAQKGWPRSSTTRPSKTATRPSRSMPNRSMPATTRPSTTTRRRSTTRPPRRWVVVVDGQAGPEHDAIGPLSLRFSPDGKRVAYVAKEGGKWFVVLDGKPGLEYDRIWPSSLRFSPDWKRLAYAARKGNSWAGKWFVVVDGQTGPEFDTIVPDTLHFSPDGKRIAYAAVCRTAAGGWESFVVVDEKAGPAYDRIWAWSLHFSPDSKRLAYMAEKGGKWVVVVDGKAGPEYDLVGHVIFSPDSKRLAYVARKGSGDLAKWLVVVDGKASPEYHKIGKGTLVFSPDGKRFAYAVQKGIRWGGKRFVVLDGKPLPEYKRFWGGPIFRADGVLEYLAVKLVGNRRTLHRMKYIPAGK